MIVLEPDEEVGLEVWFEPGLLNSTGTSRNLTTKEEVISLTWRVLRLKEMGRARVNGSRASALPRDAVEAKDSGGCVQPRKR